MSRDSRRSAIRKRSPPKSRIEPVCVDELLTAAGMSGFLGVLESAAPAGGLQQFPGTGRYPSLESVPRRGPGALDIRTVSLGLTVQVERLAERLAGQHQILSGMSEVIGRMNAGAQRLKRATDLICVGVAGQHPRGLSKETIHMRKTKATVQNGRPPEVDWKDWVHTNGTINAPPVSGSAPITEKCDAGPLQESIAKLAYAAWEARGRQGGSAEDDWLRAEAEIRANIAASDTQS
jgi:hypothetical protein